LFALIDKTIISACINEDPRAQKRMYEFCFHLLMPLCYKYIRQEELAREMMNQGFVKIMFSLEKYDDKRDFKKWAQSIMLNTLINEYHSKKRWQKVIDENIDVEYEALETSLRSQNDYWDKEEDDRVEMLLGKLPPVSRKVFRLFAMDGFSHQEIADMLKISTGTSKWHISNARELLKKYVTSTIKIFLF